MRSEMKKQTCRYTMERKAALLDASFCASAASCPCTIVQRTVSNAQKTSLRRMIRMLEKQGTSNAEKMLLAPQWT